MMRWGSVGLIVLAAACFILGAISVAIPRWGNYRHKENPETGYFGPWLVCKEDYWKRICGHRVSLFQPMFVTYAAGVCAAVGVAALGAYGLLSIMYVSVLCNPSHSVRRFKTYLLVMKLVFSLAAALMSITAVALFATQGNDLERGYIITRDVSFYLEIVVAVFSTVLMLLTIGEYISSRRESTEPDQVTANRTEIGLRNVISNPGYRERTTSNGTSKSPRRSPNGISMTRASGIPIVPPPKYKYTPPYLNGTGSLRRTGSYRSTRAHPRPYTLSNPPLAKPFAQDLSSPSLNGSVSSVSTSPAGFNESGSVLSDLSSASTGSTFVSSNPMGRGVPLRSSLKKSRTASDSSALGISNMGFNGSSPTLSRTSSIKKVRIQSPTDVSTDV